MSLSSEYRVVAKTADLANGAPTATTSFHALMPNAETTMCGHVDALDVKFVKHPLPNHKYAVSCGACQVALRVERQRRGREGRERMQKRHAEEREAFKRDDASDVSIGGKPVTAEEREVLVIALRMYIDGPAGEVGSNEIAESMLARIAGE